MDTAMLLVVHSPTVLTQMRTLALLRVIKPICRLKIQKAIGKESRPKSWKKNFKHLCH